MASRKRKDETRDERPPRRVVYTERNHEGWAVYVCDVPMAVLEKCLVTKHEPDLRQMAEGRVIKALWNE